MNFFANLIDVQTECRKPQLLGYIDKKRINVVFDSESQINLFPADSPISRSVVDDLTIVKSTDKRILAISGETLKVYGVFNLFISIADKQEPLFSTYEVIGSKQLEFFLVKGVHLTVGSMGMRILDISIQFPWGYREFERAGQKIIGRQWKEIRSGDIEHVLASRRIFWEIVSINKCFVVMESHEGMILDSQLPAQDFGDNL